MTNPEDTADPDEYTPEPGPVTAAQEYAPEVGIDDPVREADPADVAEQLAELPLSDGEELDDDEFD